MKNLSLGGALLIGPPGLGHVDAILSMEISNADNPRPLALFGEVVREDAGADRATYGVSFLAMDHHRAELARWIEALTRKAPQAQTEQRRVTGALFVDYVRMLRGHKGFDWSKYLKLQDFKYLTEQIEPNGWYPMETFERMGLAILSEVAQGELPLVREWGRKQFEAMCEAYPTLIAQGDPRDSLMRFQVLRNSFFDFGAMSLTSIADGEASMTVAYGMSAPAEEAASIQTLGFFERLIEMAGGGRVEAFFSSKQWSGEPHTTIELRWAQA